MLEKEEPKSPPHDSPPQDTAIVEPVPDVVGDVNADQAVVTEPSSVPDTGDVDTSVLLLPPTEMFMS